MLECWPWPALSRAVVSYYVRVLSHTLELWLNIIASTPKLSALMCTSYNYNIIERERERESTRAQEREMEGAGE